MEAIKVDDKQRVRLTVLQPGDLYEPEFTSADVITLRRLAPVAERPAQVRFVKENGRTVMTSDRPVSLETIKELLADFP